MTESRYRRQELVRGIGAEGQRRIREARVALVGSGALGCAAADQLVRAGIGYLRLIDPDKAEISNLQRQVLLTEQDAAQAKPKAHAAAEKLRAANGEVQVEPLVERLDGSNAPDLLSGVDLVLDGTDNFRTRYLINRYCVAQKTPWIFAGVLATGGMCLAITPGTPCLHCALGPEPSDQDTESTSDLGILCPTVTTIASLQVTRALKLICRQPVPSTLAIIDLWKETARYVEVERDPACPVCGLNPGGR